MAQFDVHPMPGTSRQGYVLDVQADLLSHLSTRAVVPLLPLDELTRPIRDLNPVFDIRGRRYALVPQAIATVPLKLLEPPVVSLAGEHDILIRALDILLTGV